MFNDNLAQNHPNLLTCTDAEYIKVVQHNFQNNKSWIFALHNFARHHGYKMEFNLEQIVGLDNYEIISEFLIMDICGNSMEDEFLEDLESLRKEMMKAMNASEDLTEFSPLVQLPNKVPNLFWFHKGVPVKSDKYESNYPKCTFESEFYYPKDQVLFKNKRASDCYEVELENLEIEVAPQKSDNFSDENIKVQPEGTSQPNLFGAKLGKIQVDTTDPTISPFGYLTMLFFLSMFGVLIYAVFRIVQKLTIKNNLMNEILYHGKIDKENHINDLDMWSYEIEGTKFRHQKGGTCMNNDGFGEF